VTSRTWTTCQPADNAKIDGTGRHPPPTPPHPPLKHPTRHRDPRQLRFPPTHLLLETDRRKVRQPHHQSFFFSFLFSRRRWWRDSAPMPVARHDSTRAVGRSRRARRSSLRRPEHGRRVHRHVLPERRVRTQSRKLSVSWAVQRSSTRAVVGDDTHGQRKAFHGVLEGPRRRGFLLIGR